MADKSKRKSFSERQGLVPARTAIQIDGMDDPLKIGIWNILHHVLWENEVLSSKNNIAISLDGIDTGSIGYMTVHNLWIGIFHEPIDELNSYTGSWEGLVGAVKHRYFGLQWNRVYDLIEYVANNCPGDQESKWLVSGFNSVLQEHVSGYRFSKDGLILPLTSEREIAAVDRAMSLDHKGQFSGTAKHIEAAVKLLRQKDYRNSIKESISAVESTLQSTSKQKGDFAYQLKSLGLVHPALIKAFSAMYGYTSDADGIRHALGEKASTSPLGSDEAIYFLVSCSAFSNLLIAKATSTASS